ncbi:MAG: patatin-like phospholipase family protein [Phycisphaerales bacterium]|nr:patatin-like phospholipase family protein [Phycisphaerales bacterium]
MAAVIGCSNVNVPLNGPAVALEDRVGNQTRAALHAQIAPLDARGGTVVRPRRWGRPLGASAEVAASRPAVKEDPRHDGYFVGVAISGGGSRSANFSAACLFQLQRIGLMEHVDYLSSVSGGSLTAACYCLWGDQWNLANAQAKLSHSFATDMIVDFLMPWNMVALGISDYDRSDLLAKSLRKTLFTQDGHELTFGDLRNDRPHLLINATDLQSGRRFVFCNESFDEINSDLAKYPMAYAVAASSAVPVVMHQVTLRDYSTIFKQYRHLVDGGVVDNLGVQTLAEVYEAHLRDAEDAGGPSPYPRGAVLIVIDAATNNDSQISSKSDTGILETLQAGAGVATRNLLNRSSTATLAEMIVKYSPDTVDAKTLRQQMWALQRDGYVEMRDRDGRPVRIVHLSISRVAELSKLPFHGFGESLNNIQTYFNIDPTEAYYLYQAADLLVEQKFKPVLDRIAEDVRAASTQPASEGQR